MRPWKKHVVVLTLVVTAVAGVGAATAALLLVKRAARQGFTTVFDKQGGKSSG